MAWKKHELPYTEYVLMVIWCTLCLILGLFGNAFVLYASTVHRAIKIDRVSRWIIETLAVADILNCLIQLIPMLIVNYRILPDQNTLEHYQSLDTYLTIVSLDEKNNTVWFGYNTFCEVSSTYRYLFLVVNMTLLNLLSANKLARCVSPFWNLSPGWKQRAAIPLVALVLAVGPTLWTVYGYEAGFLRAVYDRELLVRIQDGD